jgi:hypothetical protein
MGTLFAQGHPSKRGARVTHRQTTKPVHVRTDLRSAQLHSIGAEVERAFGGAGRGVWSEDRRRRAAERWWEDAGGGVCSATLGDSGSQGSGLKRSLGR